MNRLTLNQVINPVIPLTGIPLKGYSGTHAATKLSSTCFLKASYRLFKCKEPSSPTQYSPETDIATCIKGYTNAITFELLDLCVDGHIELECQEKIPDIVLFVIGTAEVVLNLFRIKRTDYEEYLKTFAVLDHRFWGIDPSYIATLRCSYILKKTCICRNVYDTVKLKPLEVSLRHVYDLDCGKHLCLELESPFDHPSTIYTVKFASHVISKISRDLFNEEGISKSTLKHLSLLHDIETRTVLEAIGCEGVQRVVDRFSMKPVADIKAVRFYYLDIKIAEGSRGS